MSESTAPSTEIESVLLKGRIALDEGKSLKQIADAMIVPVTDAPVERVVPGVPAEVVLDDETKKALRMLGDVFAVVQPTERRSLSVIEREQVHAEQEVLKRITTLLETREESLKEIVRNHMDVLAQDEGRADDDTPVDDKGHYILARPQNPERAAIPGTNMEWSREYRAGSTSVNTRVLDEMLLAGEISREVYLAMTVEKRVFDENKAMLAAAKPGLRDDVLRVIKAMAVPGKPSTSLFKRKKK